MNRTRTFLGWECQGRRGVDRAGALAPGQGARAVDARMAALAEPACAWPWFRRVGLIPPGWLGPQRGMGLRRFPMLAAAGEGGAL